MRALDGATILSLGLAACGGGTATRSLNRDLKSYRKPAYWEVDAPSESHGHAKLSSYLQGAS